MKIEKVKDKILNTISKMSSKNQFSEILSLLSELKKNDDNLNERINNLNDKLDNLSFSGGTSDKPEKKIKKVKDPNKPTRPLQPRLRFGNELKKKLRGEDEFAKDKFDNNKDLLKALEERVSEEWNKAENNKKSEYGKLRATYQKEYETKLEQYKKDLEKYNSGPQEESPESSPKKSKGKEKAPKPSTSTSPPDDSDDDDILEIEESDLESD